VCAAERVFLKRRKTFARFDPGVLEVTNDWYLS